MSWVFTSMIPLSWRSSNRLWQSQCWGRLGQSKSRYARPTSSGVYTLQCKEGHCAERLGAFLDGRVGRTGMTVKHMLENLSCNLTVSSVGVLHAFATCWAGFVKQLAHLSSLRAGADVCSGSLLTWVPARLTNKNRPVACWLKQPICLAACSLTDCLLGLGHVFAGMYLLQRLARLGCLLTFLLDENAFGGRIANYFL